MANASRQNRLRIAVHGIGSHAQKKLLPAIQQCQTLELVGISTRNIKTLTSQCETWLCPGWGSIEALLEATNPNIVLISTPIGCHFEDGLKVLKAGVHLWSEKAFTLSISEAETLVKKASQKNLAICVSLAYRYHPLYRTVCQLINSQEIGALRSIVAQFGFPHTSGTHSIYDPQLSGGALLDVGYYPLIISAEMLGDSMELVGATVNTEKGYEINTSGAALLSSLSGATATAIWGYGRDYINRLEVIGENGTIVASPIFSKPEHLPIYLTLRRQNKDTAYEIPIADQFVKMLDAFAIATRDSALRHSLRETALEHQRLLSQVAAKAREMR